jgi:hypothetical protein
LNIRTKVKLFLLLKAENLRELTIKKFNLQQMLICLKKLPLLNISIKSIIKNIIKNLL